MKSQFLMAFGLSICLNVVLSSTAHAEITKCVDESGQISYSNTSCGEALPIARFTEGETGTGITTTTATAVPALKVNNQLQIQNAVVRDSPWANPITLPVRRSLDRATLAEAREVMHSTDRALSAMRSHTIVSSR